MRVQFITPTSDEAKEIDFLGSFRFLQISERGVGFEQNSASKM